MSRSLEELKNDLESIVEIPEDYLGPITYEITHEPVVAADGQSYGRVAIETWLRQGNRNSPMTGAPLSHRNLTLNYRLKSII